MPKWVNVMDVARDKDLSKRYVQYEANGGKICFTKSETGATICQEAIAETKRGWNNWGWKLVALPDNEVILINYPTNFSLELVGKVGYENGKKCLREYARLYDNIKAGTRGEPLSESVYEALPDELKSTLGSYWLSNKYKNRNSAGMKAIFDGKKVKLPLCYKSGEARFWDCSIRIVIRKIPLDTIVDIGDPYEDGSTEYRAMKMIMSSNVEKLKDFMKQLRYNKDL